MSARSENSARLRLLSEIAAARLSELLDRLDVKLRNGGGFLVGTCPVHGGDNPSALNLYPEGHTTRGNWRCNTRHCERVFYPTVVGFTRGVLSHNKYGYSGEGDQVVPFKEAVNFLCDFVGQKFHSLKIDRVALEKNRFIGLAHTFAYGTNHTHYWPARLVRAKMDCPSPYFLSRGFSPHVLERFSVGDWKSDDESSSMFERAVCPIFNEKKSFVLGVTGRSTLPFCRGCGSYHVRACPPLADRHLFSKWRNNKEFNKGDHLYGLWNARDAIRSSGKVLLVESPGNVLRASEAGIDNCVGLFGTDMSDAQQVLLESSGAMTIFLAMDDDEAGEVASQTLQCLLSKCFRVKRIKDVKGDLGEMSADEVKKVVLNQMR